MPIEVISKIKPINSNFKVADLEDIAYDETHNAKEVIGNLNDLATAEKGDLVKAINEAKNVKADWNEADTSSDAYILNKPDLTGYVLKTELERDYASKTELGSYALKTDLNSYTKQADFLDVQNDLTNAKTDVDNLEVDVTNLTTDVNGVKTSVTNLTTSVNGLTGDVNGVKANVNSLTTDLNDLSTEVDDLKQSVSDGKALIASAITDMGVDTLATDTWAVMAENIRKISNTPVYYTITINYLDEDGNVIHEPYSQTLEENSNYDVSLLDDEIVIDGYTYVGTNGDSTTGIMNGNKVINVYYEEEVIADGDFHMDDIVVDSSTNAQYLYLDIAPTTSVERYSSCGLFEEGTNILLSDSGMFDAIGGDVVNRLNLTLKPIQATTTTTMETKRVYVAPSAGGTPKSNVFTMTIVPPGNPMIVPETVDLAAGEEFTFNIMGTSETVQSCSFDNDSAGVLYGANTKKVRVVGNGSGTARLTVTLYDGTILTATVNVTGDLSLVDIKYPATKKSMSGTWNALGDSYTAGYGASAPNVETPSAAYCALVAADKGLTVNNYGVTGSCIATGTDAQADTFLVRYSSMQDGAALVTVFGGTNDFLKDVPIGNEGDVTTDTFYGALNSLISSLKQKFSTSRIVFFTPIKLGGTGHNNTSKAWNMQQVNNGNVTLKDYRNAIVTVCNTNQIEVVDLFSIEELDCTTTEGRANYGEYDLTHPNSNGQRIIADYVKENMFI